MNRSDYDHHIKGFSLLNACIVSENFFAFTAQELPSNDPGASDNDYDYPTRVITIKNGNVGNFNWDSGFKNPKLIHTGDNGYLITSEEGRAKETRDTPKVFPQYTLDQDEFRGSQRTEVSVECLRNIAGHIYACGTHHKLLKRIDKKRWITLTDEQQHPILMEQMWARQKAYRETGVDDSLPTIAFLSFDGFSEQDLYACGGMGDLWHYNGERWLQLNPPVNSILNNLVCADDGYVYITSTWGDLIKGYYRNGTEHWELISHSVATMDVGFEDATWFKGRLYLSNSWGLFVLENNEVTRVDFSGLGHDAQFSFQHVTSGHGVLLSYGPNNAVLFDGETWTALINPHHLED